MADYAVMPYADYEDACDAVREKTGGTDTIVSGDLGTQIRAIESGSGAPPVLYISSANVGIYIGPLTLDKSNFGYLLDCEYLLIVPAGGSTDSFAAFVNIETGECVSLFSGYEVGTSFTVDVQIVENDDGETISFHLMQGGHLPDGDRSDHFPTGDYYIVGAKSL